MDTLPVGSSLLIITTSSLSPVADDAVSPSHQQMETDSFQLKPHILHWALNSSKIIQMLHFLKA